MTNQTYHFDPSNTGPPFNSTLKGKLETAAERSAAALAEMNRSLVDAIDN